MSATVSKGIGQPSSALKMEVYGKACELQGIGSILSSECQRSEISPSLRRNLSADMSSKKWLTQNGFSSLKKVASSEGFPVAPVNYSSSSSSSSEEEEGERRKKNLESPAQLDIWTSIFLQKADDSKASSNIASYVHPLVRRSASSLSEKSLDICTESLGSETGSDGFSFYPSSETDGADDDKEEEPEEGILNYNCFTIKKALPRSFPPPLLSLSIRNGTSIQMRSHRQNGRLVLEAVPVSSYNNFHAQRQGGRLLLSFVNKSPYEDPTDMDNNDIKEIERVDKEEEGVQTEEEEEEEEDFDIFEEDEKEKEIGKIENQDRITDKGIVIEMKTIESAPKMQSGLINVQKSVLAMTKPLVRFTNRNPTCFPKLEELVDFEEEISQFPQSLPPLPWVPRLLSSEVQAGTGTVAASFNSYQYSWRKKQTPAVAFNFLNPQPRAINNSNNKKVILSKNLNSKGQQQLLVMRGNKAEYFVQGCKEPRRSMFMWEPCCIATT